MANDAQISLLLQGAEKWNSWRKSACPEAVDFAGANLCGKDLGGANLGGADFRGTKLAGASLFNANLDGADLGGADLRGANVRRASLTRANLSDANLGEADLAGADLLAASLVCANLGAANLSKTWLGNANLNGAKLDGTYLHGARLLETMFAGVDLSAVVGLESCFYLGPSIVDNRTLEISGPLPLKFLRGVGFSDPFIESLPSISSEAGPTCRCYISYSSEDQEFADQLYADLQSKGVRCWFAPDDMSVGASPCDALDDAVTLRDKLLLILSDSSIRSDWVEDEVRQTLADERRLQRRALFPVRIDEASMKSNWTWARRLRERGDIGDFTNWGDRDAYRVSLEKLLRDLTAGACSS